jgi:hypothetical protein
LSRAETRYSAAALGAAMLLAGIVASRAAAQGSPGDDPPATDAPDPTPESEIEADGNAQPMFMPVQGPVRSATLYADGQVVETEWESVWRPMCNCGPAELTKQQFLAVIDAHRQRIEAAGIDVDGPQIEAGGISGGGGGLNIVFNLDDSVPSEAEPSFGAIASIYEAIYSDPITITVNVTFETMPAGILGATGIDFTPLGWKATRLALKNDMDSNDNVQNHIPSGTRIKVRYNGNSSAITLENRVFWTHANFKAAAGSVAGSSGDLSFNSSFSWDFDPANGVTGYSFQDVLAHELGHVLGFTSGADFRTKDMEVLDIFRFQRTDGGSDYNPDSYAEFKARARLVDFNTPNNNHNVDVILWEYRMSDGDPYQCGHFREQFDTIGLMDPALYSGETLYPGFLSAADKRMFDAIGWDRD